MRRKWAIPLKPLNPNLTPFEQVYTTSSSFGVSLTINFRCKVNLLIYQFLHFNISALNTVSITGGANPNLLDRVMVDYFGSLTPLNQVARIAASGSNQLVVEPFDKSLMKEVEKGISMVRICLHLVLPFCFPSQSASIKSYLCTNKTSSNSRTLTLPRTPTETLSESIFRCWRKTGGKSWRNRQSLSVRMVKSQSATPGVMRWKLSRRLSSIFAQIIECLTRY